MSPFLAWGDFHARLRFARSTIPEEKWGTTRSLVVPRHGAIFLVVTSSVAIKEEMKIDNCSVNKKNAQEICAWGDW